MRKLQYDVLEQEAPNRLKEKLGKDQSEASQSASWKPVIKPRIGRARNKVLMLILFMRSGWHLRNSKMVSKIEQRPMKRRTSVSKLMSKIRVAQRLSPLLRSVVSRANQHACI
jgi:hypothetical protein